MGRVNLQMLYGAWISSSFSGLPDKWLTLLRTTGSVCSGQVAHFETGQVAQFRQESPGLGALSDRMGRVCGLFEPLRPFGSSGEFPIFAPLSTLSD